MNKKSAFYIGVFIFLFVITIAFFYWFGKSTYFLELDSWVKQNYILFAVSLLFLKALGVLWPPIPAGLITLAAIPILGWKGAYLVDLIGSSMGGSVAYLIGYKYGHSVLGKLFDDSIVEKITKIKVKAGREIEAVFMYRLAFGSVIIEAIYYGAGVLKVNFTKFLIGSVLSHIVVGVPTFLLAENIFTGKNLTLSIVLSVIALFVVYKTKGRYFE